MLKFLGSQFKKYLLLILLIRSLTMAMAKDATETGGIIMGRITTSDHQSAAGVTIRIKETNKSTTSEEDGSFVIKNLSSGTYELNISLVGFETLQHTVIVKPGKVTEVNLQLSLSQKQLQQVVVTTNRNKFASKESDYVAKLTLKNLENSQVYTIITKSLLADQMVVSVDDALKNAPGLQKMWEATGRSADGGSYYNARGFIEQSQLRNGVAGNVSAKIDAANLEKVEVIKGPSSTLFGGTLTSYGGLINRVTKKPYAYLGGEVSYATGSYNYNRISADINTPLDSAKNILLRVNTAYNYEGSFQDNGFEKGIVIAPSLTFKLNDRLSFSLDAELYNGSGTSKQMTYFYFPSTQLGIHSADKLGIDYNRSYSANSIYQSSQNSNFFGQMNYKISKQWTSQTNYTSTRSFSDGPYVYFYLLPNSVATGNPSATGSDNLVRADQSSSNSSMQVTELQQNLIGDFTLGRFRNRLVGGLDYFSQNSDQLFCRANFDTIPKNGNIPNYTNLNKDNLNAILQNKSSVLNYPFKYKTNTYSTYLSDIINITDRLIASAALRVDHFNNSGSYNETTGIYTGKYQQTVLSPKFGLVYQPIQGKVALFANYQNGFTNKTGTDYAGKTYKPQQSNQVEGGVKLDAFDGRLSSTISYYSIKVTNLIRPYAGNPIFAIQDGTQLSKGIEAEVTANPFNGMNLITGFAYNDSKFEKASSDVEGRRPASAMSPYTANFWMSYKLPGKKLQGLGFGLGGNYASDNKILNSIYYGEFVLPAYTILNAALFFDQPKFRVGIKVDNLTNQQYWIGYTTANPQKLRSIAGSISFKF